MDSDTENTQQPLTPFKVWLHPVKSWRRIEQLKEELLQAEAARREASELALRISEENRKALDEQAEARVSIAEELRKAQDRAEQLARRLEEAEAKIKEYGDIEAAIMEFDKKLDHFEEVKEAYEKRISTLRLQLDDANRRLRERGSDKVKDPSPIHMSRPHTVKEKDPSSWFRTLPDDL